MKLQDLVDVLVFEDNMKVPLRIYQPNAVAGEEPEHLIEFLVDEHRAVKDEILTAEIDLIQIGKSTGGSVSKPLYDINILIVLKTRVLP